MDYTIYKKKQGLRIRLARRIANVTQEELVEKLTAELGYDFGDAAKVSRIEKGKQDIPGRELVAMSVVLGQPQAWLQGVTDDGMEAPIIHVPTRPWFRGPIEAYAEAA